jgi:hypothetical protein
LLAGLACHVLWTASRTETGPQWLLLEWRDATWGLAAGLRTPLCLREPVQQADDLLREVDLVIAENPADARLSMGAALVLDRPSPDYWDKHQWESRIMPWGGGKSSTNQAEYHAGQAAFDTKCSEKCFHLAALATELDPGTVGWWRLRAMLLWEESTDSNQTALRTTEWINFLDEAARHDPENALYDYLAADFYWNSAAEMARSQIDSQLPLNNDDRLRAGIARFEAGQQKPYLVVGSVGAPAMVKFLSNTRIPLIDQRDVLQGWSFDNRLSSLVGSLWKSQRRRAEEEEAHGRVVAALTTHRQNLRLAAQFREGGASNWDDISAMSYRTATAEDVYGLALKHQSLFSPDEREQLTALEANERLAAKVWDQARLAVPKSATARRRAISIGGNPGIVIRAVIAEMAPSLVAVLLLVALSAMLLSRLGNDVEVPAIGAIGQSLAFLLAAAIAVVSLGLAPAGIIPGPIQSWVLTILTIALPLAFLGLVTIGRKKNRGFKFSLGTMFLWFSVLGTLLGVFSVAQSKGGSFRLTPFDLFIPPRGLGVLEGTVLYDASGPGTGWFWALAQWIAWRGQYLTVGLWAVLVAGLFWFKTRRLKTSETQRLPSHREFVAGWTRSVAKGAWTLAALILFAYLVCAPAVLAVVEREFQIAKKDALSSSPRSAPFVKAVQDIESNPAFMETFRAEVKMEMEMGE